MNNNFVTVEDLDGLSLSERNSVSDNSDQSLRDYDSCSEDDSASSLSDVSGYYNLGVDVQRDAFSQLLSSKLGCARMPMNHSSQHL